jgi:hypothetical protein
MTAPITALVEATILVTRQDRRNLASRNPARLRAKAGRNLAASRVQRTKRSLGTTPAALDNRGGQRRRLRKPHSEGRQGRIVAADLLPLFT